MPNAAPGQRATVTTNYKLTTTKTIVSTHRMWLAVAFLVMRFAVGSVEGKSIAIGVFTIYSSSDSDLSSLSNPKNVSASAPVSWNLDNTVDLTRNIQLVQERFRKLYSNSQISFTLLHVRFSSAATLGTIIHALEANKNVCDAFVFGFFAPNGSLPLHQNHNRICETIEAILTEWHVPTFSWSCMKYSRSDERSSVLDLRPDADHIARSLTSTLRYFRWRNVAFLAAPRPSKWSKICAELEKQMLLSNYFVIKFYKGIPETYSDTERNRSLSHSSLFRETWESLQMIDISAVVMCFPNGLVQRSSSSFIEEMLASAYAFDKAAAAQRAYIAVDTEGLQINEPSREKPHVLLSKSRRSTPKQFHRAVYRSLRIADVLRNLTSPFGDHAVDDLLDRSNALHHSPMFRRSLARNDIGGADEPRDMEFLNNLLVVSPTLPSESAASKPRNYQRANLLYFMDSLLLAMVSTSQAFAERGSKALEDDKHVLSKAIEIGIKRGFTGPVLFNPNTSRRQINFTVWDVSNQAGDPPVPAMHLDTTNSHSEIFPISVDHVISWTSGQHPQGDACDQSSFLCDTASNLGIHSVVIALFGGIALAIALLGLYIYKKRKKERQSLIRGSNKMILTDDDLTFLRTTGRTCSIYSICPRDDGLACGGQGMSSNSLAILNSFDDDQQPTAVLQVAPTSNSPSPLSCAPSPERRETTSSIDALRPRKNMSEPLCRDRSKGEHVFLKKLCGLPAEIKKPTREILKQLKELHHENVAVVFGIFTSSKFHYLVTEFSSRGTLKELIERNDFELHLTFKLSLIRDLVRGMKYVHSSGMHHGRLKSNNCIIDGRFALKVTDHGLCKTRTTLPVLTDLSNSSDDLLWTAPELLVDPTLRQIGTKYGDYYSFGIICQEIVLQCAPFAMLNISSEEVIEKVKKLYLRPCFDVGDGPAELVAIAKSCWIEDPQNRMTFSAVHSELKQLNRNQKHNIVEFMIKQMEDHSKHLEDEVCKRTNELREEKRKTEQLLMRMLPPSVALRLMANKTVEPESFDECTIYFSDICGFTTIALSSSPLQVVSFLNDLYTCFDAIIEKYETYKVETIGDAYMVSSGIPKRIGDRHAEETALMALDILSATSTFRIRHRPEMNLQIRIGMHSGPAVAGVVGLTMPRYCLFGDTINTASRLETTGMRNRIHVSTDTKAYLDKSRNRFILERKGLTTLKGRGDMETWWLTGMEGYENPLPNPGDAHGPSHGLSQKPHQSPKPSGNQSSNNSKSLSGNNFKTKMESKLIKVQPGAPNDRPFSTAISTRTTAVAKSIRSGSSFLVPTPLALLPQCAASQPSKPQSPPGYFPGMHGKQSENSSRSKPFQCSRSQREEKSNALRNAKVQISNMLTKRTSVAPLKSHPDSPSHH